MPDTLPIRLEIERAGEVTEEIRSDNTIYIDLEVLQSFFKTSIIDVSQNLDPFHRMGVKQASPAASDENKIVQDFLEFYRARTQGRLPRLPQLIHPPLVVI